LNASRGKCHTNAVILEECNEVVYRKKRRAAQAGVGPGRLALATNTAGSTKQALASNQPQQPSRKTRPTVPTGKASPIRIDQTRPEDETRDDSRPTRPGRSDETRRDHVNPARLITSTPLTSPTDHHKHQIRANFTYP